MRLLVIGGSGYVGRMVLPHLAREHEITIFDLVEPKPGPWVHVIGDVQDVECVTSTLAEIDALVYMAMNTQSNPGSVPTVANAFDVNVKGVYFAFSTARDNGVPHGVYTSSMSVFSEREGLYPDESAAPDATDYYGLTKRLGEEVCKALVADGGITITALRLCFPVDDDAPPPTESGLRATTFTRAKDVAGAILAALEYRNGFDIFTISGDTSERMMRLSKARKILNWQPTSASHSSPQTPDKISERVQ
ncbi:MAG TPA: NAD(P)-dependent oxidoreductase [Acidimicrobiales bacterium]|nr:NAD(P)-dependent oxidoreductase [Acidimicrobiales bacterium]